MKDLTDVISRLKNIKGEISLSDLSDMGLNQYYIKKMVDDGVLYKTGRGKYQVEILDREKNLPDDISIIQDDIKKETASKSIQIQSTSSYMDVSKYTEEISQINSLIQNENYNALSVYVSSMGYTDERLLDLEKYVLEKMYNASLFDEAEPYYSDLENSRGTKTMLDKMFSLRLNSISKKND